MKKWIFIFILIIMQLSACSHFNNNKEKLAEKGSVNQGDIMLFPKSRYGFIGDPMPFFHEGKMNMFYLLDERGGSIGFHPFALLQTTDFLKWRDFGVVIPYENDIYSQDLALGTGSIIYGHDKKYHAFYTGHNGSGLMPYKEMIQHATSTDLINWTKHPELGFYGGVDDFRDPYIYFDENTNEYWMLITTRQGNRGVIKRYISTDLYNWDDAGIFYSNPDGTYNMECPTLIEFNGYYYLTFSAQGTKNERVVHYRYTDDLSKGFTIPERDHLDGWGFYAGRLEKIDDNRMILAGWNATKTLDRDYGEYMWGGHLVVHEVVQKENGELGVSILPEIDNALSTKVKYEKIEGNVEENGKDYLFNKGNYRYILFEELLAKPTKAKFKVDIKEAKNFGITFNAYNSIFGDLNVYFDFELNTINFYCVPANEIVRNNPEISYYYDFSSFNELDITLITENSTLVVYINDEVALTSRAYNMADSSFGFFTIQSNVTVSDFEIYE